MNAKEIGERGAWKGWARVLLEQTSNVYFTLCGLNVNKKAFQIHHECSHSVKISGMQSMTQIDKRIEYTISVYSEMEIRDTY